MGESSGLSGVGSQDWSGEEFYDQCGEGEDGSGIDVVLVGKMISDKPFNKAGLKGAIYRTWHFVKDLIMDEVEGD